MMQDTQERATADGRDVVELARELNLFLADNPDALIPLDRHDVRLIKAVKFTDEEWARIEEFIEYLNITVNPETGQPYLADRTFSKFVQLAINLLFRYFAQLSRQGGP